MSRKYKSWVILALSISFIIIGIINGEVTIVLRKAIQVCFECIGVG